MAMMRKHARRCRQARRAAQLSYTHCLTMACAAGRAGPDHGFDHEHGLWWAANTFNTLMLALFLSLKLGRLLAFTFTAPSLIRASPHRSLSVAVAPS